MTNKINIILAFSILLTSCQSSSNHSGKRSEKKLNSWFDKGNWNQGWNIKPDESINRSEFAIQYFRNPDRWNKAFYFLNSTDLKNIKTGRYELDDKNLYVNVDEYTTKNEEDSYFEAHREYIDIQYLVYGKEKIGITDLCNTAEIIPYDSIKDVIFLKAEQNNYRTASPDRFFVFFPGDAHRPCVKTDENSKVRKVVVKIKIN